MGFGIILKDNELSIITQLHDSEIIRVSTFFFNPGFFTAEGSSDGREGGNRLHLQPTGSGVNVSIGIVRVPISGVLLLLQRYLQLSIFFCICSDA